MENNVRRILEYWWKKISTSEVPNMFNDFRDFANWSLNNGYKYGRRPRRIDKGAEYSPDNMEWVDVDCTSRHKSNEIANQKTIDKWDAFIKPIREKYRKELETLENMSRKPLQEDKQVRECFQYEHPYLVREGIVFHGNP